jgi:hypothetical protein
MSGIYCADSALQSAVGAALESYGLEPNPAAADRRPAPARTYGEQVRRIDLAGKVLALVRREVPVGADDRRLIERLVDSACQRTGDVDRPPLGLSCAGASVAAFVAYAAAGGGLIGSFESFHRTFLSDAELLEPVADRAVGRQDVKPAPLTTNPSRRPPPPGTPGPAKTNPTRTIRSSRWTAGRKGVGP